MNTILRFFKPGEFTVCEQYEGENLIAPQLNSVVTLEYDCESVYRVDDVNYVYDDKNVMIDVELRPIEDGYWDEYDVYLHDDKFECDGECECCEPNTTGTSADEPEKEEDKTNYSALLRVAVAALFGDLDVTAELTKE